MLIVAAIGAAPRTAAGSGADTVVVEIATGPLVRGDGRVHPNVLLAMSIDESALRPAHADARYDRTRDYIGYFDHRQCYQYAGRGADGYFRPVADADALHECRHVTGGRFSGNFMNWASATAIDVLRYALTGGDRVVDTPSRTVLQRATLPEHSRERPVFPVRRLEHADKASHPSAVTPFSDDVIVVMSCGSRIHFATGAAKPDLCNEKNPQASLGTYTVRVEVCAEREGPLRPDLCRSYGRYYKPAGALQKHADRMRVGVFGHLMDDSPTRYGGVLRERIQYLGERDHDSGFASKANAAREWNPATGVFTSHADKEEAVRSGVIRYLNTVGHHGRYKRHAPASELFYEALRYYRSLGPTSAATQGMTPTMKDGFQVVQSWQDPIMASCQKNYLISIAGPNTDCDTFTPGKHGTGAGRCGPDRLTLKDDVDFAAWTDRVGNLEGRPQLSRERTGMPGGSYDLAGMAYWANTRDIRPDLGGKQTVRTLSVDLGHSSVASIAAASQHPLFYAGKYGGFEDANEDGHPFITADPMDRDGKPYASNVEWEVGAGSGIPKGYLQASDPVRMVVGIRRFFDAIAEDSGTTSAMGLTVSQTAHGGDAIYRAEFHPGRWAGSLTSHAIRVGSTEDVAFGEVQWEAGQRLTDEALKTDADRLKRRIVTLRPDGQAVPFSWDAIGSEFREILDTDPVSGMVDGRGKDRLEYLHGVRAKEDRHTGGIFRSRDSVLGDIVRSVPVHVGAPTLALSDPGYREFFEANRRREPVVYVGANDGMMHAFDARTGDELFAYVPRATFPALPRLTDPYYRHRPYVDATPHVAEAKINQSWKTVLVSGFGGGAQGVFALDVTHPRSFGVSNVLWEFTDRDDRDMGNVMGEVAVAKFHVGAGRHRWFAVVSSGLNNNLPDGSHTDKASGVLFLLALDKPASAPWKEKSNYWKFSVPSTKRGTLHGLGPAAVVFGTAREAILVYAGDLQGNLWRFDFTGDEPFRNVMPAAASPLFQARDSSGRVQPITAKPRIVFAPGGGYLVLFGTGKLFERSDLDPSGFATQSFYAIHDSARRSKTFDRADLEPRRLLPNSNAAAIIEGKAFILGAGTGRKRGWYLDYPESERTGERSLTSAAVRFGQVFFNTVIFDPDPCAEEVGRAYALSALTGLTVEPEKPAMTVLATGAPSMPAIIEGKSEASSLSATGIRSIRKRYAIVQGGTVGIDSGKVRESAHRDGQISWREITDFQQLRRKLRNAK